MKGCLKISLFCLFFLFFLFRINYVSAQTKNDLEKKRKQKEEEIEYTKKLIEETEQKQKESIQFLQVLNSQILNRETYINNVSKELVYLEEQISENLDVIRALERDLLNLKAEYANMVTFAYKNRNTYNKIGFILSAETFNQSFKRLKIIQNYSEYRKKQMQLIEATKQSIQQRYVQLQKHKNEKIMLMAKQNREKQDLLIDKESQSQLLNKLKNKEVDLRRQLREKERIAAQLNRAIEDLIRKEMEEEKRKKAKINRGAIFITPEAAKISHDFASFKQKLPWPVEKGFISETYGTHEHPTLAGVFVNNNGINITTDKNSNARSIFAGEVRNIINIPGANYSVIIKHGDYYSVYSNLENVSVKVGDKVKIKQPIGVIHSNSKTGTTELHLELWKLTEKMDPMEWLYPQ